MIRLLGLQGASFIGRLAAQGNWNYLRTFIGDDADLSHSPRLLQNGSIRDAMDAFVLYGRARQNQQMSRSQESFRGRRLDLPASNLHRVDFKSRACRHPVAQKTDGRLPLASMTVGLNITECVIREKQTDGAA